MLETQSTSLPLRALLLAVFLGATPDATAGRLDKPRYDVDVRVTVNNGDYSGVKTHTYSVENTKAETQRMSFEERENAEKKIAFEAAGQVAPTQTLSPNAPASTASTPAPTAPAANPNGVKSNSFAAFDAYEKAKEKAHRDAKLANSSNNPSGVVWSDPGIGSANRKSARTDVLPNSSVLKYGKNAEHIASHRYQGGGDWQLGHDVTLKGEDKTPYDSSSYGRTEEHWSEPHDTRFEFNGNFTGRPIDVPEYQTRPTLSFAPSRFTEKFYVQSEKLAAAAARESAERFTPDMMTNALGERRYKRSTQPRVLSMQDINRYNFRSSHSDVSGFVPVSGPNNNNPITK